MYQTNFRLIGRTSLAARRVHTVMKSSQITRRTKYSTHLSEGYMSVVIRRQTTRDTSGSHFIYK